jgi:hypothetical protein
MTVVTDLNESIKILEYKVGGVTENVLRLCTSSDYKIQVCSNNPNTNPSG